MSTAHPLYDVTVWLEASDDPEGAAESLVQALSADTATAARADGVRGTEHGVAVHFPELRPQPPPPGAEYKPPRSDEPTEAGGQEALRSLEQMHDILPVVRALIAVSAARVRAGIAPDSQRVVIEVTRSAVHSQDELRHS